MPTPETVYLASRMNDTLLSAISVDVLMSVFVAVVLIINRRSKRVREGRDIGKAILVVIGALGCLFTSAFVAIVGMRLNSVASDLDSKRYLLSEGCLSRFVPSVAIGHTPDEIEVAGRNFEYSDNSENGGFHQTEISGGPIHANTWVRIYAVGSTIGRLDVVQGICPPAPRG